MPFIHRVCSNQLLPILLLAAVLVFVTTTARLEKLHRPSVQAEMQVALPVFVQIFLAGGDRFLAANTTVFRSLIVSTDNNQSDRYITQGRLQSDAAWMNPYHEDNYYLAAATLPWNGQVDAAQKVLALASNARPFDMLPPFYYAFNQYYFNQDPIGGAEWLSIAEQHATEETNRINLHKLAAKWTEKSQDRAQALKILNIMAAQSRYRSLKLKILQRAERVRHLMMIDAAISDYQKQFHKIPENLSALVDSGHLKRIPDDPLKKGYTIDVQGKAQPITPPKK